MTHRHMTVFATIIMLLSCINAPAQEQEDSNEASFSFEEYHSGSIRMPYRQAVITGSSSPSKLVVYLHGGTNKGNNNTSQMNEPGIDSIARFISEHYLNSVFIIPQCPGNESWGGKMTDVLKNLIDDRKSYFTDIKDIYIFGGSMGGTGTWTMISKFPSLFSAAMPVAGNPSKCDANNVVQTPLFTVMGTDDQIMEINTVRDFISLLNVRGAKYVFETEYGWSHEDTCIKSYTADRLSWVFSNSKQSEESGIMSDNRDTVTHTRYWTLSGTPVINPTNGFYLMQEVTSDKNIRTQRIYIR